MKRRFLIDTVILIDHLNGVAEAARWLESLKQGEAAISVITRAEVLAGADASDRPIVGELLDVFPCLDITPDVADAAAELRRLHRWKLPDAFQAALAGHHALRLVTRNTRDLDPAKHPFVLAPYRIV